jgi:hypothetical protein
MAFENSNRGSLRKNPAKHEDQHPDYKGTIEIDGKQFWLSAWIKTDGDGAKWMSLSAQPRQTPAQVHRPPLAPQRLATG